MAAIATFFNKFLSFFLLLLLLLYLGCFIFSSSTTTKVTNPISKKRKISPSQPKNKTHKKPISSSWTFIKHLFCSKTKSETQTINQSMPSPSSLILARSSQHSLVSLAPPESPPAKNPPESKICADDPFSNLRNDIFPCTACGEIFPESQSLEHHQSIKHAVSELSDGDAGNNIVRIIFNAGWTNTQKSLKIDRVLKIRISPKMLSRFEEYRELVKAKASRNGVVRRRDERCIADGNEVMRFHCSTFLCDLGHEGNSGVCQREFCNICEIIKSGFSAKLDGISTWSTSWRAHVAIPEEMEAEFKFMNVKRAMLVCRVVAGRVGYGSDEADKEDGGFDSVMSRGESESESESENGGEELLVFNPRALLPCFVIVYTV